MQALDPVYGYDDHSVWLVSSEYADAKGLKLTARILNVDATEKFSKEVTLDAAADSTARVLELPQVDGLSPAYFLDLRVTDAGGKLVGSNFYWLSTKNETIDWAKSNWYVTPTESYADYTALAQLPKVKLNVSSRTENKGNRSVTQGGEEILPAVWQDNYVSLLPGEKREITAMYRLADLGGAKPDVEVRGWNVE